LTSKETIQLVKNQKKRKEKEAAELEQRHVEQVDQKAAKVTLEEQWKDIVRKHNDTLEEWTAECNKLQKEGLQAKDLPRMPRCPPKPKLPVEEHRDKDERLSLSSSEDGD
jgi:hypothetical protein